MIHYYKVLLVTALSFSYSLASSQGQAAYQFFGFSSDLHYASFEVYETGTLLDQSVYSRIFFIDVAKNDYAIKPLYTGNFPLPDSDSVKLISVDENRKQSHKNAQPLWTKFNIPGNKLGTHIDLHSDTTQVVTINGRRYTLNLVQTEDPKTDMATSHRSMMFEVNLVYNGHKKILQSAVPTPKSWGYVNQYTLRDLYYVENKVAIFIEYSGLPHEGGVDGSQMIVTAVLDEN
jgi:hypothetical protein